MSVAVGLDVGTSGVKALAVDQDGEVVAGAEVAYGLSTPRPGWAEQDPEDWWRATEEALAALGMRDVAGIGGSEQLHGPDSQGSAAGVIRPPIGWNDHRMAPQC